LLTKTVEEDRPRQKKERKMKEENEMNNTGRTEPQK
jgi:hypothetical protein